MTTTDVSMLHRVFVDTNVWIALAVHDHPFHEQATSTLVRLVAEHTQLFISGQILRECAGICTIGRGLSRVLTWDEVTTALEVVLALSILLEENEASARMFMRLGATYQIQGRQVHDANIVAVMISRGLSHLLTFNPGDFRR